MAIGQDKKPNEMKATLTEFVNQIGEELVQGGWCKKSEVKNIVIESLFRSAVYNEAFSMCQYIADRDRFHNENQ